MKLYEIAATNPNENGLPGVHCLCHAGSSAYCEGPYIVFPEAEMDSLDNPFAVLSVHCAEEAIAFAKKQIEAGELASGFNETVIEAEAEEEPVEAEEEPVEAEEEPVEEEEEVVAI